MSQDRNSGQDNDIYRAPSSDTSFTPQGDAVSHYVGPKEADYYARQFDQIRAGTSITWNWPAFFVSSFWLLYRKMWLYAFLYWIVLPVVLTFVSVFVGAKSGPQAYAATYYSLYFLVGFILLPMFANSLYFRHARNKVNKIAAVTDSEQQQAAELARIGGTSNLLIVVMPFVLVFVIGILAAIAIPAYQDYTIRAQVAEGLALSAAPRAAVQAHYNDTGAMPADNEAAGLERPAQISGHYVSAVEVSDGTVYVIYGRQAHDEIYDDEIFLTPSVGADGEIRWHCGSDTIQPVHLPASCR